MNSSKLSQVCDTILEAGWLLAALTTPLFVNLYTNRSNEPDKLAVLHIVTIGMAAAWLIGAFDRRRGAIVSGMKRAPWFAPIGVLLGIYGVSTVTSLLPRISWSGAYPRPEGLYALLCYAVIFITLIDRLRTRAQLDRLITTIILTSVPVALYSLIQRAELDPLPWSNAFASRVGSTLGNPIFLGAYLIMIVPLTVSRLFSVWQSKTLSRQARIAFLIVYALIAAAQLTGIVLAGSRGPFLGLLAGLFLLAALLTWIWRRRVWTLALLGIAGLGVIGLIVMNVSGSPASADNVTRLTSLTVSTGDSGAARLWYWDNAARLVSPHAPLQSPEGAPDPLNAVRPLIGYGPDTLYFAFRQVAAPGFEAIQSYDVTSDRSHNETWDVLTQTGGLGWLAYQFFYLSLFTYGFRGLGLMTTRPHRNFFIAAWIACTLLGAAAALVVADARYLGLGLGAGNVAALIVFVVVRALRQPQTTANTTPNRRDQLLVAALLASMTAHLLEIQFGLALVTTRVALWMFAAIGVVLSSGRLEAEPAREPALVTHIRPSPLAAIVPSSVVHPAFTSGLITAALLCTLLYAFTTLASGQANAIDLIGRALTFNSLTNSPTYILLALLAISWGTGLILTLIDLHRSSTPLSRRTAWQAIAAFGISSLGLAVTFELTLGGYLSGLTQPLGDPASVDAVLARAAQVAHIFDLYLSVLLGVVGLIAVSELVTRYRPGSVWLNRRSSLIGAVIAIGLGGGWLHFADLKPIRADVYHKLGVEYEATSPGLAVGLFRHAVDLSPDQDYYYLAWGRALVAQAKEVIASRMETPSQLNDHTRLNDVLALSDQQLAQLNRLDLLYVAQVALQQARTLNPLYPDHTLNLARFYLPELPVNTDARSKLAALADDYYAQAVRLSPSNAAYWNEWAEFELTYKTDPDRALEKLAESLRLNATYADTYRLQGQVYSVKGDWSLARAAYQRAVDLRPQWGDAYSRLAFTAYQLHDLPAASAAYQRFIELSPESPNLWEAHKNLALIYHQQGDVPQALNELQLATDLAADEVKGQLNDLATAWQAQ